MLLGHVTLQPFMGVAVAAAPKGTRGVPPEGVKLSARVRRWSSGTTARD